PRSVFIRVQPWFTFLYLKNFMTALKSSVSTGRALMIRPAQSAFFEMGAGKIIVQLIQACIMAHTSSGVHQHLESTPRNQAAPPPENGLTVALTSRGAGI